jgi:hypothetical protein
MSNKMLGICVVTVVVLSPYAGSARTITLSGTHSESQVRNACASVGGNFVGSSPGSGPGYGCINIKNGNSVSCNGKGKCIGNITRTTGPSRPTLGGVIGSRPVLGALSTNSRSTSGTHTSTGPTLPAGSVHGGTGGGVHRH